MLCADRFTGSVLLNPPTFRMYQAGTKNYYIFTEEKTRGIVTLRNVTDMWLDLLGGGSTGTRTYPGCKNRLFRAHSLWCFTLLSLDTEREGLVPVSTWYTQLC